MVSCHIFSLGCGASAAYVWAVSVSRTLAHSPDGCASYFWREGHSFGRRKYRPGYSPANTQVGFSRQMTANPDPGIRFWTPSSVFVALSPLRQPAPPPAICGDSVAALALERAQSPMVFSTTRDGPQAQKGSAHGHSRRELLPHRPRHGPLQPARGRGRRPLRRLQLLPRLRWQAVGGKLQAAQAAPQAPSARSARFSSGASEDEVCTWAKAL